LLQNRLATNVPKRYQSLVLYRRSTTHWDRWCNRKKEFASRQNFYGPKIVQKFHCIRPTIDKETTFMRNIAGEKEARSIKVGC
jgi:hypothetical protein